MTVWNRLSWAIGLMLVVHLALGGLLLVLPPDGVTAPFYSAAFGLFLLQPSTVLSDSWAPMLQALDHIRTSSDPLYQTIFFDQSIKFQYPPSSLPLIHSVEPVGGTVTPIIMNGLCWVAVPAIAVVTVRLHLRTEQLLGQQAPDRRSLLIRALLIAMAALAFYPLARSFKLGQIQTLLTLVAALALLANLSRRHILAGVLIGGMTAVKPYFILIVVWALLRRNVRLATACLVTAAVLQLFAVVQYGLPAHVEYVEVVQFMGRHGEVFHPNQSMNGLANRLVHSADVNLEWHPNAYAPFHPFVYGASLAATVIFVLLMLFPLPRRDQPSSPALGTVDLAAALLAVTLASPIAWEHHHSILIPVLAVAVPVLLRLQIAGRKTGVLLIAIYLIAGQRWTITDLTAPIPGVNILQSYLFIASTTLVLMLIASRRHSTPLHAD